MELRVEPRGRVSFHSLYIWEELETAFFEYEIRKGTVFAKNASVTSYNIRKKHFPEKLCAFRYWRSELSFERVLQGQITKWTSIRKTDLNFIKFLMLDDGNQRIPLGRLLHGCRDSIKL